MTAIKSIEIGNLQRLKNITVNFKKTGVTAIMGANGSGKTTLLQALACGYKKQEGLSDALMNSQVTYRYTDSFKSYGENNWIGSKYLIEFEDEDENIDRIRYEKNSDLWLPSTEHKKHRYVKFVSILDCVPDQEKDMAIDEIGAFETTSLELNTTKKNTFLSSVSGALKKQYEDAGFGSKEVGLDKFFFAKTSNKRGNQLTYPSHYMGTGEQKMLNIIHEILKAPKGALILIEELDLALHEFAIRSLIPFLIQQAEKQKLQIVFTTHWLGIKDYTDDLSICSLYENEQTQEIELRESFDPQFVYGVDGNLESKRQIKVWVEDGLAMRIVEQLTMDCQLKPFVDIRTFGSIQNAFTVAGSTAILGLNVDRTIVVTDGDALTSEEDKNDQMAKKVSGGSQAECSWRDKGLELIYDFNAPNNHAPEKVLLDFARKLVEQNKASGWLINDLNWISEHVPRIDGKTAIYELHKHKNMSIERIEGAIIQEVCGLPEWETYVAPVKNKLEAIAQNIGLSINSEVAA
ncbi:MAG: ATP-binding protein [Colwellia polaris]|jgi:energy-coupling factor transporter ATP-binding protein EcfA2